MVKKLLATKTLTELIVWLVIFIAIPAVLGVVFSILDFIPILGWVFGIVGSLIGLLCLAGAILAIVGFVKHHL